MFRTRDGKFAKKAASFNNLTPFKSTTTEPTKPLDSKGWGDRVTQSPEQ